MVKAWKGGGGGGCYTLIKRTGVLVIPFRVKKVVLAPLRVFSINRSTVGASVIPFRGKVFSQSNMTGNNVLFYNWYLFGVKEVSSHTPCPFDMEVFPQGTSCNDH